MRGEGMAEGETNGARLIFAGDMMIGRQVSDMLLAGKPPEAFWGDLRPNMLAADAVIGNLENPITTTRERWPHIKAYRFAADPRTIEILAAGNVRGVSLANNHMLDCNAVGMFDTRRHLAAAGIAHTGAGADLKEALEPALINAGDLTIGMVSLTNTLRPFAAGPARAGTAYLPIRADAGDAALLAVLAGAVKQRGADILVLSMHWGPNLRPWPPRRYRAFARKAIEVGFDIVHGHSAHILQALEFHRSGLILYDTGDFLEDWGTLWGFRCDRSFLFEVEVAKGRRPALTLRPASLSIGEVNFAKGAEADTIREEMIRRCRGYAVEFTRAGEALIASPPGGHA